MNKSQEGLEVYYPQAGLEVVPGPDQKWALHYEDPAHDGHNYQEQPLPQTVIHDPPVYSENDKEVITHGPKSKFPLQSKWKLRLAIAVTLLVILAAVLGGVLGTTLHHKKNNSSSKPSSTASATASAAASPAASTSTPSPTSGLPGIRAKSPLSVTGWLTGSEYSIRVVFQSDDDMIQYIAYESKSKAWKQTPNIIKAKAGSPLALTSFETSWYGTLTPQTQFYQAELFFLDSESRINEWSWDTTANTLGTSGSLTPYTVPTSSGSRLTSYWPFIIYQEAGFDLHEIVYDCRFSGCWFNRTLNRTGYDGADIVIVPAQQNLRQMNIIYQRGDRKLMSMARNSTTGDLSTSSAFSIDVPATASFAALTVVRPSSDNTVLDTYVLYQDSAGTIKVVWNDVGTSWKGPATFPAFNDADNGTSIACLTQAAFFTDTPLQSNNPLSRCYFQAKGALREVRLEGSDWEIVGDVNVVP